jgi:hypothetical protein
MKSLLCGCLLLAVFSSQVCGDQFRKGAKKRFFCDDTEAACTEFATRGECKNNPAWLNQICGPSCKFATLIRDDADIVHDICEAGWTDEGRITFLRHLEMNTNQSKIVPSFTETGYKVVPIPDNLFDKMITEREKFMDANPKIPKEVRLPGVVDNLVSNQVPEFITFSRKLHRDIAQTVQPYLEEWTGEENLENTDTYGLRRYLNGHQFHMHVDVLAKYVFSAILNVAQELDEDWVMHIVDAKGNIQKVTLSAGDMLLYESAKVVTGYPEPMRGKYYEDFFVHFRPKNWKYSNVPSGTILPVRDEL